MWKLRRNKGKRVLKSLLKLKLEKSHVRSRGVWFGFAEKMFMFCSAKSRRLVF